MDLIQKELLEEIAGLHEVPAGAYNIRASRERKKKVFIFQLLLVRQG